MQLGSEARAEAISPASFDAVLVATGANWDRPSLPGAEQPHVRTVDELASWLDDEQAAAPARVVVVGGDKAGLGLAGVARRRGAVVHVLHESEVFAESVGMVGRWRYVHEAREQGIVLHPSARLLAIDDKHVEYRSAEEGPRTLEARGVWIASGAQPDADLCAALRARGVRAEPIGDCRELRLVEGAMYDAARIATQL